MTHQNMHILRISDNHFNCITNLLYSEHHSPRTPFTSTEHLSSDVKAKKLQLPCRIFTSDISAEDPASDTSASTTYSPIVGIPSAIKNLVPASTLSDTPEEP